MTLLFAEAPPIPLHALAALLAVVLGGMQLAMKKGTRLHKALGWIWTGLMAIVAITSFFIHEIKLWGQYSPIHLLSLWTLLSLGLGIYFARIGKIKNHQKTMVALYGFGLILAGLFTLMPGRVMHQIIFGG